MEKKVIIWLCAKTVAETDLYETDNEGNLLFIRGSRKKRLIVEIPGFLTAAVEVDPEFITLL